MRKSRKSIVATLIFAIALQISLPIRCNAQEVSTCAYDIRTKTCVETFDHSNTMCSINPTQAAIGIPSDIETINFQIELVGYMHYDYLTGKYVSSSAPVMSIVYSGETILTVESASCYYRDNGNSVTFYYSGKIKGKATTPNGLICIIDYGNVSGNFTVNKY